MYFHSIGQLSDFILVGIQTCRFQFKAKATIVYSMIHARFVILTDDEDSMLRRNFLIGMPFTALTSFPASSQGVCRVDGATAGEKYDSKLNTDSIVPDIRTFEIFIRRGDVAIFKGKRADGSDLEEEGVIGELYLNGYRIGDTLENNKLKIPAGEYPGYMRYVSKKNFVQGPFGVMANIGDFLIEVGKVDNRTAILLHGGNKPWHSTGCILLGSIRSQKDAAGKIVRRWIDETNALRVLRKSFYGSEMPSACPNTAIQIKIT